MTSSVLMASGGLDSTVLAWWLRSRGVDFQPLFIDYGQNFVGTELATLERVLPPRTPAIHVGRLVDFLGSSSSVLVRRADPWTRELSSDDLFIPYRNLLFLTAGVAYAAAIGASTLFSAFINSNEAREVDATKAFLDAAESLFGSIGDVGLEMPFRNLEKTEVATIGVRLGAPVAETYSCQIQPDVHCGVCPNCVDRTEALSRL